MLGRRSKRSSVFVRGCGWCCAHVMLVAWRAAMSLTSVRSCGLVAAVDLFVLVPAASCDFTGGNWTISVEFQDETSSAVERVFEITAVSQVRVVLRHHQVETWMFASLRFASLCFASHSVPHHALLCVRAQAHDCEAWSWVYIIGVPAALLLCGVGILIFLARRRSPTPRARPRSVPTPGFELEAVSAKHLRPPAVDNRTASQRARFVESSRQPEESAALAEQLAHIARAPLPSAPAPQYATTAGTRRQYARSDLV